MNYTKLTINKNTNIPMQNNFFQDEISGDRMSLSKAESFKFNFNAKNNLQEKELSSLSKVFLFNKNGNNINNPQKSKLQFCQATTNDENLNPNLVAAKCDYIKEQIFDKENKFANNESALIGNKEILIKKSFLQCNDAGLLCKDYLANKNINNFQEESQKIFGIFQKNYNVNSSSIQGNDLRGSNKNNKKINHFSSDRNNKNVVNDSPHKMDIESESLSNDSNSHVRCIDRVPLHKKSHTICIDSPINQGKFLELKRI